MKAKQIIFTVAILTAPMILSVKNINATEHDRTEQTINRAFDNWCRETGTTTRPDTLTTAERTNLMDDVWSETDHYEYTMNQLSILSNVIKDF